MKNIFRIWSEIKCDEKLNLIHTIKDIICLFERSNINRFYELLIYIIFTLCTDQGWRPHSNKISFLEYEVKWKVLKKLNLIHAIKDIIRLFERYQM